MHSSEGRLQDPSVDGEARLAAQLEAASNLALFGASKLGRDVCAAIYLNHLNLLAANRDAKRRLVAALLLLGMTNLLTRLLRALDGIDLETTKLMADGDERLILSFSNGTSLNIPASAFAPKAAKRGQAASHWSAKILEAAAIPASPAPPPLPAAEPANPSKQQASYASVTAG